EPSCGSVARHATVPAAFGVRTALTARPRAGCRRSAGGSRCLELLIDATGKALRHPLSDLLHDAGASELRNHATHCQVGVHDNARPLFTWLQLRRHGCGGTASAACLRALGPDANRVRALVHALDGDPTLIGNADRPQLDLDPTLVRLVVDHLGERRTGDTVRDLRNVKKVGPRRLDRRRQLEPSGDHHAITLVENKRPAPHGTGPSSACCPKSIVATGWQLAMPQPSGRAAV